MNNGGKLQAPAALTLSQQPAVSLRGNIGGGEEFCASRRFNPGRPDRRRITMLTWSKVSNMLTHSDRSEQQQVMLLGTTLLNTELRPRHMDTVRSFLSSPSSSNTC
jgi:hypothetical protein